VTLNKRSSPTLILKKLAHWIQAGFLGVRYWAFILLLNLLVKVFFAMAKIKSFSVFSFDAFENFNSVALKLKI